MLYRYGEKVSTMESRPLLLLQNVQLPDGRIADITVKGGLVTHRGSGTPAERSIDCTGSFVLPAAVDMHVHMRGGSQSAKEDWQTGSRSALAGGVTLVVDQPNTLPPIVTPDTLHARVREAKSHSLCHFAINSGVTSGTSLHEMWRAGAMAFGETFFAPSSYGNAISGGELENALAQIKSLEALATIHAEEVEPGFDTTLDSHRKIRSPEGELRAVLAVLKRNTAEARLHFCHLSTRESVDAAAGSVEVTPHHLFLSAEQFPEDDARGKVNPPLRSERERKALLSRWQRIDVIASDHAPHTRDEKHQSFGDAPAGIPGVETMMPVLVAEVMKKTMSLEDVIRKTSFAPAKILGINPPGFVPGLRGDFAVYPKKMVKISADTLHSRCGWTPFEGRPGVFPDIVIMGGSVVFEEGEFFKANPVWIPGEGYRPPGIS